MHARKHLENMFEKGQGARHVLSVVFAMSGPREWHLTLELASHGKRVELPDVLVE